MIAIRTTIIKQEDRAAAAKRWLPVFIALMTWVFSSYLLLKGLKKIIQIDYNAAIFIGLIIGVSVYLIVRLYLFRHSSVFKN